MLGVENFASEWVVVGRRISGILERDSPIPIRVTICDDLSEKPKRTAHYFCTEIERFTALNARKKTKKTKKKPETRLNDEYSVVSSSFVCENFLFDLLLFIFLL